MTVSVLQLFLTMPWVGLQCVIVVFPEHTNCLSKTHIFYKFQAVCIQKSFFSNFHGLFFSLKIKQCYICNINILYKMFESQDENGYCQASNKGLEGGQTSGKFERDIECHLAWLHVW